ncbi:unnamed protein product [Phytophthora lilii]|uniref:Unnamed protein product n=1 Tax=Phytophthora lilii TaxID=2077276 RepID=A0A9W6TAN3_9STRA|nr:unnamed protein product [Phytophthora lilii]
MTVRSIVEMFESLAASGGADAPAQSPESPGRGNVYGLVTYYDGLAVVEEPPVILPTKKVRLVRHQPAVAEPQPKEEQEQEEAQEQEEEEQQQQEDSNQDTSEPQSVADDCGNVPASPVKVTRKSLLAVSKIPAPKSREFHLAACSVRKPASEDTASRSRTSSASSNDASQPLYVPPPTPISARIRSPCTSYAAFVARIENSSSRLLDFEKDERWLGQVESMKGRVEALKRRNHMALAREVASTPRKSRSMSECSGVSTASTASMSSMDTPEVSFQASIRRMTTEANASVLGGTVLNAGPLGAEYVPGRGGEVANLLLNFYQLFPCSTTYGKLPPLNPDDLKLPPPPPSAADKVTNTADAISISEVWEEIKAKTREMCVFVGAEEVNAVLTVLLVVFLLQHHGVLGDGRTVGHAHRELDDGGLHDRAGGGAGDPVGLGVLGHGGRALGHLHHVRTCLGWLVQSWN